MPLTPATLAADITAMLAAYKLYDEEFQDWLNGSVGGGPALDGKYPLTSRLTGVTRQTTSPAQLEDDVTGLVNSASSYATAAQTAQTGAETAETNAGVSETNAASHRTDSLAAQTAAENAQSAAENAAVNALAQANNAAASYDAFDDRYLGSFTTALEPTVDNDGDPLLTGAMYWNTTDSVMKIYTGSAWADQIGLDTSDNLTFTGTVALNGTTTIGGASITSTLIGQWNTAFGWGDHAAAGYLLATSDSFTGDLTLTAGSRILFGDSNTYLLGDNVANTISLGANNSDTLVLEATRSTLSGSLGIGGITPTTWTGDTIFLSSTGNIQGGGALVQLSANIYLDTAWKHYDGAAGAAINVGSGTIHNYVTTTPASVAATALVGSTEYIIEAVGTTDFTLIGAASNTVGLTFTATGAGTGTGTATVKAATFIQVLALSESSVDVQGNLNVDQAAANAIVDINSDAGIAYLYLDGAVTGADGIYGQLSFFNSGDSAAALVGRRVGADDASDLEFWTQPTLGTLTKRMTLASTGRLTIDNATYGEHLALTRSSEEWRFNPSTDGSLDLVRSSGTGTAKFDVTANLATTGTLQVSSTTQLDSDVNIGVYSTTQGGNLYLNGTTANKRARLQCSNGNLHIDSDAANATYLNYFYGTGGVFFGNGASGYNAYVTAAGAMYAASFTEGGTALSAKYLPQAGGTLTGELTISRNPGTGVVYHNGHIELKTTNADPVSVGFHRSGYTACQLRHASNGLILSGTSQTAAANLDVKGTYYQNGVALNNALGVEASTVSTVVRRNSSGDINARLFRSEYDSTNATINYIMTQIDTASNNYIRPSTPAQFRASVNAGYIGSKVYTVSTSAPSGGSDGDFWFVREA